MKPKVKIRFLFFFILHCFCLSGQEKNALNNKIILGIYYSHALWYNQAYYWQPNKGYDLGLSGTTIIFKKILVSLSPSYGKIGYASQKQDSLYYKNTITASYVAPGYGWSKVFNCHYEGNYSILRIPFSIQYLIFHKKKLYATAGVGFIAQVYFNRTLRIYDVNNELIYKDSEPYSYSEFLPTTQVSVNYCVNNIIVSVLPVFRIKPSSSFYDLSMGIGINYKF